MDDKETDIQYLERQIKYLWIVVPAIAFTLVALCVTVLYLTLKNGL